MSFVNTMKNLIKIFLLVSIFFVSAINMAYAFDVTSSVTVTVTVDHTVSTGTLTTTDCLIPAGASTCDTTLTWATVNPKTGFTSSVTTTPPDNTQVGTPANSGTATFAIAWGAQNYRSFFLYHNVVKLATATPYHPSLLNAQNWIVQV